jgi:hypothetical protein
MKAYLYLSWISNETRAQFFVFRKKRNKSLEIRRISGSIILNYWNWNPGGVSGRFPTLSVGVLWLIFEVEIDSYSPKGEKHFLWDSGCKRIEEGPWRFKGIQEDSRESGKIHQNSLLSVTREFNY